MKRRKTHIIVTLFAVLFVIVLHQKKASKTSPESILSLNSTTQNEVKNVLGTPLQICSKEPLTGFFRDGKCNTNSNDYCRHIVCAEMTKDFLNYTKKMGNDLTTSNSRFPGLKEGDFWCLCVSRWMEALNDGVPPPVLLHATHEETLEYIPIEVLKKEAVYTKEF